MGVEESSSGMFWLDPTLLNGAHHPQSGALFDMTCPDLTANLFPVRDWGQAVCVLLLELLSQGRLPRLSQTHPGSQNHPAWAESAPRHRLLRVFRVRPSELGELQPHRNSRPTRGRARRDYSGYREARRRVALGYALPVPSATILNLAGAYVAGGARRSGY
jgi:hypothetical protein